MTLYALRPGFILRDDGANIPLDPANGDYAAYLTWLDDGGVPDPYVAPAPPHLLALPDFMARLTPTEQAAMATLSASNAVLTNSILFGLARGYVDLSGAVLANAMAICVAGGVFDAARAAILLTP